MEAIHHVYKRSLSFCPESLPKPFCPIDDSNGGYKLRERYMMNTGEDEVVLRHIARVGYASVFPLPLKHVKPGTAQFEALLNVLESPEDFDRLPRVTSSRGIG